MENRSYIVLVALIVALGGFLMGFDASVISGVNKFIEPHFGLSKLQLGWAVSSLTLTATLAMLVAGPISDRIGRKAILRYAAVLYALSALASALAPTFALLVIARMIGGLGVGISLIIAPMYIAEVSPAKVRGQMVSFNQLNIVLGISVAFFTNYLILKWGQSGADWATRLGLDLYNWRWMLGVEALPAVLYFLGLFFVPRSPRWLLMVGKEAEAEAILARSNGRTRALEEIALMKRTIAPDVPKPQVSPRALLKPSIRLVLVIGIVVAVLQQITGINAVFFYAPMIFEQSGIGTDAAFSQAIWVGLTNLVFTILAISLIDRLGRKPLLAFGVGGIAVFMFLLTWGFSGATYTLTSEQVATLPAELDRAALSDLAAHTFETDIAYKAALAAALGDAPAKLHEDALLAAAISLNPVLILIGILGFVASFAMSIGPVMWVLFSELFPIWVRGLAISFVGLINSAVSFGVQLIFPWELEVLGSATTFFLFGVFAVLGLAFILWKVPETKGKSLEELEAILVDRRKDAVGATS